MLLVELVVADFAIIESLRLAFAPGFNVLTGETGAGKSILIDAVNALLGGRCGPEVVRAGASQARIEGVFAAEGDALARDEERSLAALLDEYGAGGDEGTIILTREIHASGRTAARVNGRLVPVAVLQQIAAAMVDIHGQGDQLSILRVSRHGWFLDRFAGLLEQRQGLGTQADQLNRLRKDIAALERDERELARRVDLLRFQVAEIQTAMLAPDEEETLGAEHRLLSNAGQLAEGAARIYSFLLGTSEEEGAADRLSEALRQGQQLARLDPTLSAAVHTLEETSYALADVAAQIRRYQDGVEFNPSRLTQVEERLDLLHRLKRKYGSSIREVIEFGEAAARELDGIAHGEERLAALRACETELLEALAAASEKLSAQRQAASLTLSQAVEAELASLNMSGARFSVACERTEDSQGLLWPDGKRYAWDRTGVDRVEFLISPNPGEPLRPLVKTASGGETSRLMLALKTALTRADPVPSLIFDEIDAGIGGRTGQVLGVKLWQLSRRHQVLCVTHLPQIASYADLHFRVSKSARSGRTEVAARQLMEEERPVEIAVMLGGLDESTAGIENARELISRAQLVKKNLGDAVGEGSPVEPLEVT